MTDRDLAAEVDAYRKQTACLEELVDLWESTVSSYDYEAAMRNAATELRNVLNGDTND